MRRKAITILRSSRFYEYKQIQQLTIQCTRSVYWCCACFCVIL